MKRHSIILLLIACLSIGCEDTNFRSSVPNVPVSYNLYITREHPHFIIDNFNFATMTITEHKFEHEYIGYAGLLIWIGMDGHYHAADLCCPHCLKKNKPVEITGFYAICPECDEQFDLSYGFAYPTKGVTKDPLRQYKITRNESATGLTLRIFN